MRKHAAAFGGVRPASNMLVKNSGGAASSVMLARRICCSASHRAALHRASRHHAGMANRAQHQRRKPRKASAALAHQAWLRLGGISIFKHGCAPQQRKRRRQMRGSEVGVTQTVFGIKPSG